MNFWGINADIPYPVTTFYGDGIAVNNLNNSGGIWWRSVTMQEQEEKKANS